MRRWVHRDPSPAGSPQPVHGQRLLEARRRTRWATAHGLLVGRHRERERLGRSSPRPWPPGAGGSSSWSARPASGRPGSSPSWSQKHGPGHGTDWTENHSYLVGEPYGLARRHPERIAGDLGLDPGTLVRNLFATANIPADRIARYAGAIAAVARERRSPVGRPSRPSPPSIRRSSGRVPGDHHVPDGPAGRARTAGLGRRPPLGGRLERADARFLVRAVADLPTVVCGDPARHLPEWVTLPHVDVIELAGLDPLGRESSPGRSPAGPSIRSGAADHERTEGTCSSSRRSGRSTTRATSSSGTGATASPRAPDRRHRSACERSWGPASTRCRPGPGLGVASVVGVSFDVPTIEALLERTIEPVLFERLAERHWSSRTGGPMPGGSATRSSRRGLRGAPRHPPPCTPWPPTM